MVDLHIKVACLLNKKTMFAECLTQCKEAVPYYSNAGSVLIAILSCGDVPLQDCHF